jgi:mono/diheme cytochrome c family protein
MFHKAVLIFLIMLAVTVLAQQPANKPTVKKVPATYTSPGSAQEMYQSYCASCHGADAKGHGPAAPAFTVPPTDLTLLARNNGGKFPSDRFRSVLSGKATIVAHGDQDMPVWGPVFWKLSGANAAEVQQRIFNLSNYLEALQQK